MKVYCGVDFGKKGAVAALDESGKILHVTRMPLKDNSIDCQELHSWLFENLNEWDYEVTVYGEKLHAIFGSGAKHTFSFGKEIGKVIGVFECLDMPINEVRAIDWQALIFDRCKVPERSIAGKLVRGKPKRDTKAMAFYASHIIWPGHPHENDGIVDALLIAQYARLNATDTI